MRTKVIILALLVAILRVTSRAEAEAKNEVNDLRVDNDNLDEEMESSLSLNRKKNKKPAKKPNKKPNEQPGNTSGKIPVIDGGWSEWSNFTSCTSTCGSATKMRMRTCSQPPPSNGGKSCPGNDLDTDQCDFVPCPSDVTDSDVTAMVDKINISGALASSNLNETESEGCMKSIKEAMKKYQDTEYLLEKLRSKKPFIRNTKITDRLGKDARLFSTLKETISEVSSEWSSPSKGEDLINHFSQEFQKWAEKGGGMSSMDKETRTTNPVTVECDTANDEYRRIDGKCNNIGNKHLGSANTAFKRFLHNSYANDSLPRGGSSLPSARTVSVTLHHANNPTPKTTKGYTHMVMQFGQFLDHDITSTPEVEGGLECCNADIREKKDICFNIDIKGDTFYFGKRECHSFTRSDNMVTNTGIREQINGITSFVDASNVYGSDDDLAENLRTHKDGKLKTHEDGPMLPTRKQCQLEIEIPDKLEDDLVAGDSRAIEQPTLASIHSLFLNEHNRIAEELKSNLSSYLSHKSPSEQDELLYQESRKIVMAEMQNIVYSEFLPIVLGEDEFEKHDLELGTVTQYDSSVDPSASNEFATVAFRFGHSLIAGIFFGNGGHQLRRHFFDEDPILVSGKKPTDNNGRAWYSNLEKGTEQTCPADDIFCTQDVTNWLFSDTRNASSDFGDDLPARNIQRGRDHGIPSYNDFRVFCHLEKLTSFSSKPTEISDDNWKKIMTVYKNVDEIDAFSGGLAENSPSDGLVGPTFACIIGKQFENLKNGDRYFFNNELGQGDDARGLMINSRETVQQRTLRDVMCDNTDICQLQKFVMKERNNGNNTMQDCSMRNMLDFDGIASDILSNGNSCKDEDGQMYKNGDVITINGTEVECCQRKWIIPYVVDGGWSNWSEYGECTTECGGGKQTRTRNCTNPEPQHGGLTCEQQMIGDPTEERDCNVGACVCGSDWMQHEDKCYKVFPEYIRSFAAASTKCNSVGANITSLETQEENDFIKNLVDLVQRPSGMDFWLSGTRQDKDSPYIWGTGEELVFTDWEPDYPFEKEHEDLCMQLFKNGNPTWSWATEFCNRHNDNGVICEKPTH